MNERHDDLASAWLDGELDDAEQQALAADAGDVADVRRARDELAAVRDALAAPVDAPPGLADAQIARALEAADLPAGADARVLALRPRRPAGRLLGRAAAAVLLLGGLGVGAATLTSDGPGGGDDAALVAGDAGPRADTGAGGGAGGAAGDGHGEGSAALEAAPAEERADAGVEESAPATQPGPLSAAASELVAAEDLDAAGLLAALQPLFGPPSSWPAEPPPPDSCMPALAGPGGDGVPIAVVAFERDGVPLELVVADTSAPYFLERGSCRQVR